MLLNYDTKTKKCSLCKQELTIDNFTKSRYSKDGYRYQCKTCNQSYQTSENKKKWSHKYYVTQKEKNPEFFIYRQAKHRAKEDYDNMEFSIELSDIVIPEVCPYLGIPLKFFGELKQAPSLDRIDSSKGYTKGNIRVISRLANIMKSNATEEELIAFANGVLVVHSKEGTGCATQL